MIRGLLGAAAVVYAGIGCWTLVDPAGALADVGVVAVDARGEVELRAMYGGLELGMAGFLAWCLPDAARARIGLAAATATLAGLGLARAGSWLLFRPDGALLPLLGAVELAGAAAGVVALVRVRDSR